MNLGARTAAWQSGLPYDEELLYISTSGKQAIDTGIVPTNHSAYVDFQFINTTAGYIFGCWNANDNRYYGPLCNGNVLYLGRKNDAIKNLGFNTERYNCEIYVNSNELYVNGSKEGTYSNGYPTGCVDVVLIFAIRVGKTANLQDMPHCRLYSFHMNELTSGDLACDIIPVLATFDGVQEACCYDKVSGTFKRNIGTGTFGYCKKDGTEESPA